MVLPKFGIPEQPLIDEIHWPALTTLYLLGSLGYLIGVGELPSVFITDRVPINK